jgi:hydrogenase maturation protease
MSFDIVVLGIGNVLLGDEGIGVHALRVLAGDPGSLRCIDGGTLGLRLLPEISGCDGLIVLDAADLRAIPGEIRIFEDDGLDFFLDGPGKTSVHEVGLAELLAIAAPRHRALIAVQPKSVEWGVHPSAAVAAAIPTICAYARELAEEWRQ